ncbi:MAG: hypothetical protein AB7L84_03565 [Acidimicrobiia bacterium]
MGADPAVRTWGMRAAAACAAVGLGVLVAGCGDTEELSLCPAYDDLVEVAEPVLEADPTSATAGQVAEATQDVRTALARVRAAADGEYAAAIDELDLVLGELATTLDGVDPDADYTTWAPLVEDTAQDVADAGGRLQELVEPVCTPRAG